MNHGYKASPAWQTARDAWVAEYPHLTADEASAVRLSAIFRMYAIEMSFQ